MTIVERLYFEVIEYRQQHGRTPPVLRLTWQDYKLLCAIPTPLLVAGYFMGAQIVSA